MLGYKLLKNNAGILLMGSHDDLRLLQEVVHEINDSSVLFRDKEGPLLGLAYDARKARDGARRKFDAPAGREELGVLFGVEILWPVLLVQARMIRVGLGFFDSTKWQQAVAFNLEAVIEDALKESFGAGADEIIFRWQRIDPAHHYAGEKLNSRGARFSAWTKAERAKNLANLLFSLDPMYPSLYKHWELESPASFDVWENREWPDPKW